MSVLPLEYSFVGLVWLLGRYLKAREVFGEGGDRKVVRKAQKSRRKVSDMHLENIKRTEMPFSADILRLSKFHMIVNKGAFLVAY